MAESTAEAPHSSGYPFPKCLFDIAIPGKKLGNNLFLFGGNGGCVKESLCLLIFMQNIFWKPSKPHWNIAELGVR